MTPGSAKPDLRSRSNQTQPSTIPQVIEAAAERFGTGEALVEGDLRLDWVQLAAAADEAARALIASGVERGDRVAIWAPNISEWVIAALGIHRAGAVVVTVNTRFKGNEALHVLDHRGRADALHGHRLPRHRLRGHARRGRAGRPASRRSSSCAGPAGGRTWRGPTSSPAPPTSPAETSAARAAEVEPGDMSDILFTSGTTGAPKGAMLGPRGAASGPTPRGPTWSACGRATATSSSTRSSTASG